MQCYFYDDKRAHYSPPFRALSSFQLRRTTLPTYENSGRSSARRRRISPQGTESARRHPIRSGARAWSIATPMHVDLVVHTLDIERQEFLVAGPVFVFIESDSALHLVQGLAGATGVTHCGVEFLHVPPEGPHILFGSQRAMAGHQKVKIHGFDTPERLHPVRNIGIWKVPEGHGL